MIEHKNLTLLPPAPGKCLICAHEHAPEQPHNRQSLFYQMHFYQEHGRWPTWADAMAHCSDEVKQQWIEGLLAHGVPREEIDPQ